MNLNLPSEVNDFVKGLVSQGRFNSEEDAIVEGVRLLMGREQLRSEIQKGVQQLDAGKFYDEETVFDEINAEIDNVEAEHQGSMRTCRDFAILRNRKKTSSRSLDSLPAINQSRPVNWFKSFARSVVCWPRIPMSAMRVRNLATRFDPRTLAAT
ncbi:hypothetical protein RE6C_04765 [Rhodopirellula europaea 6C]|uniref:Transcriptional regulator, CopG/Arc/MetJ family n=1 Tax=Rhodopirellula europaea 6C TaxID=1263867 RepID=M2AXS6_9BACT|nr:hypothetical protein RE6C_04765 [Rhodopirellula europaea 6C]